MVNALRVLAIALVVCCVLAVTAWLVADRYADAWLHDALTDAHANDLLAVGRVHVPVPDVIRLSDVSLRDTVTGTQVGHVDRLDVRMALPILGPPSWLGPELIAGSGGHVVIAMDGDTLTLARAIEDLIGRIETLISAAEGPPAPTAPHAAPPEAADEETAQAGPTPGLPPLTFSDIELELRAPGLPPITVPACAVFICSLPDGVGVDIDVGAGGGMVRLEFSDEGLRRISTHDLRVSREYALFLPGEFDLIAHDVQPEGRLDLDVRLDDDGNTRVEGVLRAGTLHPPLAPFPLTEVELPFGMDHDRFRVRNARAAFEGGTLAVSAEHASDVLSYSVDVVDADFRRSYLELLPKDFDTSWFDAEDGGNLELHVQVVDRGEKQLPSISGRGGALVRKLRLGPTRVEVNDLVARFEMRDSLLTFSEASGWCASGVVNLRGSVDVLTGDVDGHATVDDVNVAAIGSALHVPEAEASKLSGWLQGDVDYKGRVGDPTLARGGGQFSIRAATLWQVPVLDAVLDALRLGSPGASDRQRLAVRFEISGRRYDILQLRVDSDYLSLVGDGKLNRDGQLEVNIVPIKVPLGYVGDLLEYIQEQVVRLELRGTLEAPVVRVVPIKVITKNVGRFWDWLFTSEPATSPEPVRSPDAVHDPPVTEPAATESPVTQPLVTPPEAGSP